MAGNNKENKEITVEAAKEKLLEKMKKIPFEIKEPYSIWISDPIPLDPWGYYFLTGPQRTGEIKAQSTIKAFVDKYTGEVNLAACVM